MSKEQAKTQKEAKIHVPVRRASRKSGISAPQEADTPRRTREALRGDLVELYLAGIRRLPLLTGEEEVELARQIERGQAEIAQILLRYPDILRETAPELDPVLLGCLSDRMRSILGSREEGRSGKAESAKQQDQRFCRMASIFAQIDLDGARLKAFMRKLEDRGDRLEAGTGGRRRPPRTAEETIRRTRQDHEEIVEAYDSLEEARQKMIESNLRLVAHIARRYRNRGLSLADLIQEGNCGLIRAVTKFEYRRGYKFSTYATWWIRQSISRAVQEQASTVRLPAHVNEKIGKLRRASGGRRRPSGERPLVEEVVEEMDLRPEEAQRALWLSMDKGVVSLQTPVADGDTELGDFLADKERASVEEECVRIELARRVRRAVSSLQPREAEILRKRFGIGTPKRYTLQQISEEYGLSRERVRQIESRALAKLRQVGPSLELGETEDAA